MEDQMQTEENSSPLSLNDFPDELLLEVMINLNDTSLLNVTRTCKRFRAIAKEAFGKKYNTQEHVKYEIKILCENVIDDEKRYRPFFRTFGENIQAIEISFDTYYPVNRNHWIYDSMQQYCASLKRLDINYGDGVDLTKILLRQPELTHLNLHALQYLNNNWTKHSYPNLKSFLLNDVNGPVHPAQRRNLKEFFHNNRQLIVLSIEHDVNADVFNIMDLLNGMTNLQQLEVSSSSDTEIANLESTIITIDKLEFLTLIGKYSSHSMLGAMKGCKNIKILKILSESNDGNWNDAVSAICSLEKLTTLKLYAHNIGLSHLQRIIDHLPNLTRLHLIDISYKSDAFQRLPYIVASSTKLIKLKVRMIERNNSVSLSSEFIKCVAQLTQMTNGLKVILPSGRDQLVFTGGEVRRCNSIIYCDERDRINAQSTLTLMDLSDPCLEEIVSLLDAESQCVLYNSCIRMQKLVKDYISSHVFHATEGIRENVFQSLGNHISRISVANNYGPDGHVLWLNINRHCSAITELDTSEYSLTMDTRLVWPNVKKLVIKVQHNLHYQNLRLFECPRLEYLKISNLKADGAQAIDKFDHEDAYRHLTTLKFGCYNEAVTKFLLGLDETICQQMKVLSLNHASDAEWEKLSNECRQQKRSNSQLINIIMRFRNLSTLKMLVPGVTDLNTRYLFENCTKLIHIEFCQDPWGEETIFEDIKENCKQIQFIRVVGPRNRIQTSQDVHALFPTVKVQFDKSS